MSIKVIKVLDGSGHEFVDVAQGTTVSSFASSQGISNYTANVGKEKQLTIRFCKITMLLHSLLAEKLVETLSNHLGSTKGSARSPKCDKSLEERSKNGS